MEVALKGIPVHWSIIKLEEEALGIPVEWSTVGNQLPEHAGTKGCSDNWNVWISETMMFVYKAQHFPFNAQQNVYQYYYFRGLDKWRFR